MDLIGKPQDETLNKSCLAPYIHFYILFNTTSIGNPILEHIDKELRTYGGTNLAPKLK